jgi:hypothetical protein
MRKAAGRHLDRVLSSRRCITAAASLLTAGRAIQLATWQQLDDPVAVAFDLGSVFGLAFALARSLRRWRTGGTARPPGRLKRPAPRHRSTRRPFDCRNP